MKCYLWRGTSTYEYFVECSHCEIQELIQRFHIDPHWFHEGPAKTWMHDGEETFYYFISTKRKRIALLPFLAIAFGGQYNGESPVEGLASLQADLNEYQLEEFQFG